MIKLIEMECKNCDGALEQIDEDKAKCPHCGALYLIDRDQLQEIHVHQEAPAQNGLTPAIIFAMLIIVLLVFLVAEICNTHKSNENKSSISTEVNDEKFHSSFFKTMVMEIYGTSVEEVTEEELNELTSIYVYYESGCYVVEYVRNNGETKQVQLDKNLSCDMADLKNFPNLKTIKITIGNIPKVVLEQLDSLEELWCWNTPKDLAENLSCPERLKVLGCYDTENLNGVDAFTQLECLYISDNDMVYLPM